MATNTTPRQGRSRKAPAATTPAPKAAPARTRKAAAKKAPAAPAPEAPAKRKSLPNAERRNEMPHEDARGAVQFHACPTCKARKAAKCIARSGEETNHVHAARMARWDAKGAS